MRTVQILFPLYYCDPALFLPIELCFSSLNACYPGIPKLIVDDASPIDLPPHWEIDDTNVVNMGFTKTVNRLLELSTADIIIICNDDVVFHPGCLDRFFDLPDNVIASPADTASSDMDGFGCCWGMTRATYEKLGDLDEKFVHFFSDTDYWRRAEAAGVEIIKWKDIVLSHPESATYKALGTKEALLEADRRNIG